MKTTSNGSYVLSKRNQASQLLSKVGLIGIVEALAKRDSLVVVNYHRVGEKASQPFDELVYSATGEELEQQVKYLDKHFGVVTLDAAVDFITGARAFGRPGILITFDDGYIDNYQIAYPVFKKLGVQATFFLVSSYLRNPVIPWWDTIAYMVRYTEQSTIRLTYPEPVGLTLSPGRRSEEIRSVVDLYKSPKTADTKRFMAELEQACEPFPPLPADTRLFLNLLEAQEMVRGGMAVGSHTVTHQILSKLSEEEQFSELSVSREDLARDLGVAIDTLAYPVGSQSAFNNVTMSLLGKIGYRAAFSFHGGINTSSSVAPFNVKRIGIDAGNPFSRFRLQIASTIASNGKTF